MLLVRPIIRRRHQSWVSQKISFPTPPVLYAGQMGHADHFDCTQIFGLLGLNVVEKSTSPWHEPH
ncbi:hypothetical protein V1508DRAFT_428665 [Lipomyces doorenjongii]|uniref:uncharacterized protein n=1 Tax=Lipomyces doorenjongii TaxID=383834 RepID=UPI0034CED4DB